MLLVSGIDPGLTGAIAIYDVEADALMAVWDIPTAQITVGGSKRRQLDMIELRGMFDTLIVMGVKLVCVERVGGYGGKGQSASAAFTFGEVFGRIVTLAEEVGETHMPAPGVWKTREKISTDAAAIVAKAETEFPAHATLFRGPKKGLLHDRAEAAFLARYAARRIWPLLAAKPPIDDIGAVDVDKLAALANPRPGNPHAHGSKPKRKIRKAK